MLKRNLPDILAILIITIVASVLSETDRLEWLIRFPFLTLFVPYALGRMVQRKQA